MSSPSSFGSHRRTTDGIDDLVDGLRVRQGGPTVTEEIFGRSARPTQTIARTPRRTLRTVMTVTGIGFAFLAGALFGADARSESADNPPVPPTVTRTVTTTTTEAAVPASCRRVFDLIERMMAANGAIADAGEKQLDIAHAARRAIFLKDWKALDEAMHRQTELNNSLDGPNAHAVGLYAELKDAMKECRDDLD